MLDERALDTSVDVLNVPLVEGDKDRPLVGEILVHGANADPCHFRDAVSVDCGHALLLEDSHHGIEDRLDRQLCAPLPRHPSPGRAAAGAMKLSNSLRSLAFHCIYPAPAQQAKASPRRAHSAVACSGNVSIRAHSMLGDSMAYVVTAATGNIGSRVVEHLIAGGIRPRVFVRDGHKARSRFGDRIDLATGDLGDAGALRSALEKNDSLLVINTGPELAGRDALAASVAQEVGIRHLVKLSALSAPQFISVGAWHASGEAAVRASGVPFTIVQPAGFMSNALHWASSIKSRSVVRASTGDGRVAYIHPDDIAAVIALVLTKRDFVGESIPITGPQALSYAEMAAAIGRALGRAVTFESISDEQARDGLVTHGLPVQEADELASLWQAVREGRLNAVTSGVARVLGRQPKSFDQWATENTAAFRQRSTEG